MRYRTILVLYGLAVAGLCAVSRISFTQSNTQDRILAPIAGSPAVWLKGNRRAMFQPENDVGPAPEGLKLENITLTFKPTADQQMHLAALLEQQQDRSSPNYHHWLTPEQFADNFGLSAADVQQVVAWLQSQGFTVTQKARSRLWVSFSGTAAQVRSAFQTEIHNYSLEGETYFANASEPAVPAVLADLVQGITALDNYGPKPHSVFRQIHAGPNPNFTSYVSGKTFVSPADFAIIYDVNALYNMGIDGTGQSIAVMGQTDLYNNGSDITAFRSASNLPANAPSVTLIPGVSDPGVVSGDIGEASLDVEWSGAVAPRATVDFINGGKNGAISKAFPYAVDNKVAPVITVSYGLCEVQWTASDRNTFPTLAAQANSQGQTILAAAGDSGPADCDNNTSGTNVVTTAMNGYAVDFPGSSPFVTSMGGTEFNEGSGSYWQPANGSDVSPSALSYIPEMVWNDTSSTVGLEAGGGGVSGYYPKPSWQMGITPNDGARDVPDVSLNASNQHDGYLVCEQGKCVNGYRYTDQTLTVSGGTSAGAPAFGAIVALINQFTKTNQGTINTKLYALSASAPAAFHDVTTGNNIVPCTAGTANCPQSAPFQIGYTGTVGYDLASGLGSVDAYNLATAWDVPTTGNLPAPTLTAPANGATGVALSPTFTWTAVAGNAGYLVMVATNPADLTTHPATNTCSACALAASTSTNATSYLPTSPLPEGTYYWQVQAIEPSSSAGVAAWSNIFVFTTTGGTLSAATLSSPANGATGVALQPTFTWTTVAGNAGYRIFIGSTQAALLTDPSAGACAGCTISVTTAVASYTPGASTLTGGMTYYWEVQALAPSGDGQNGPWSTQFSFTTVPPDFSLSASPSNVTIAPGVSGTSTVTLTPINGFSASPTFSCIVAATLAGVTCSVGGFSNNAVTATITASSTAGTYPSLPRNSPFGKWRLIGIAILLSGITLELFPRFGRVVAGHWSLVTGHFRQLIGFSPRRGGHVDESILRSRARPQGTVWSLRRVALGAVLPTLLISGLSCGGGSSSGGGNTKPLTESGNVTVTGTANGTSHTATISVTVS